MVKESPWAESVRWSCERIVGRSDRTVVGCTERELRALQHALGRQLPQAYAAFLTAVGVPLETFFKAHTSRTTS
jgi:hypothetical protein